MQQLRSVELRHLSDQEPYQRDEKKRGWSQNKQIAIQIKWTNSHELCSKYWVKLGLNNRINNFYFVNLKDDYKINKENKKGKNKMNRCMLNKNKNEN